MKKDKNDLKNNKSKSNTFSIIILSILLFLSLICAICGYNFGIKNYKIKEEQQRKECLHKDWKIINSKGDLIIKCKKCGINYKEVYNDNSN